MNVVSYITVKYSFENHNKTKEPTVALYIKTLVYLLNSANIKHLDKKNIQAKKVFDRVERWNIHFGTAAGQLQYS